MSPSGPVCGFCKKAGTFASTNISPVGADGLVNILYCSSCGGVAGATDHQSVGKLVQKVLEELDEILKRVKRIEG